MKTFLFSLLATPAMAGVTIVKGGNMCAGVDSTQPAWVAYGPCTDTTTEPPYYFTQKLVGMGGIKNIDTYLTDPSQADIIEHYGALFGASEKDLNCSGTADASADCKYAKTLAGANIMAKAVNGATVVADQKVNGFIGTASYLLQQGSTKGNQMTFEAVKPTSMLAEAGANDKTFSSICITKGSTGTTCGPKKTWNQGDYKFSIYGASYVAIPAEYTHFGVRAELSLAGTAITADNLDNIDLKINGAKNLANVGNTDVSKLTVVIGTQEVDIDFPKDYLYGKATATSGSGTKDDEWKVPVLAGKELKIRVSKHADAAKKTTINVDFIFDAQEFRTLHADTAGNLNVGNFFVYDPTVTGKTPSGGGGAAGGGGDKSSGVAVQPCALIAICVAVFSMFSSQY